MTHNQFPVSQPSPEWADVPVTYYAGTDGSHPIETTPAIVEAKVPQTELSKSVGKLGGDAVAILSTLHAADSEQLVARKDQDGNAIVSMAQGHWITVPSGRQTDSLGKGEHRMIRVTDARFIAMPDGSKTVDRITVESHGANTWGMGQHQQVLPDPHNYYRVSIGLDADGNPALERSWTHRNGMGTPTYAQDYGASSMVRESQHIVTAALHQLDKPAVAPAGR